MSLNVGCTSGGQLIRLAVPEAQKLGMQLSVLTDNMRSSAGKILSNEQLSVVPKWTNGTEWWDEKSLVKFAELIGHGNIITTEWENIPAWVLRRLEELWLCVRPGVGIIEQIQDRISEKDLIERAGGTVVPFRAIHSLRDLEAGYDDFGPCILKTRRNGYDGKWQGTIRSQEDLYSAWQALENAPGGLILEKRVENMTFEASVILGRGVSGHIVGFDPIMNIHENGILRFSIVPAPIDKNIEKRLRETAESLLRKISLQNDGYIGLLTIEMFIDTEGKIYINELAPRPHNSGHATLDSHDISQNHVWMSAVAGLPMQTPVLQRPIIMRNILSQRQLHNVLCNSGKHWQPASNRIYDYEKLNKEPDEFDDTIRKLGHINTFKWDMINDISSVRNGNMELVDFLKKHRINNQ